MSLVTLPSDASSAFGPALVSTHFDETVEEMIRTWIDTYISEFEVREGLNRRTIDRPKSYNMAIDAEHWPEEALPGILIVSAAMPDAPERMGGGLYSGW